MLLNFLSWLAFTTLVQSSRITRVENSATHKAIDIHKDLNVILPSNLGKIEHIENVRNLVVNPFDTLNANMCWRTQTWSIEDIPDTDDPFFNQDWTPVWKIVYDECPSELSHHCGLGCTKTLEDCQSDVYSEITTTAELAYNIGQIFLAFSGLPPAPAAMSTRVKEAIGRLASNALQKWLERKFGVIGARKIAESIVGQALGEKNAIDFSLADPTGLSAIVHAFWKPYCPSLKK